eukprot:CAMPEP_0170278402 /NCGR_PEP_ID=MMETSP0116_2-20130129/39205_1 /TAXON_ID=400756 /ORGANISM="Durinskia baltica, Strain CSIRO CS-38" /LENGTH=226 /DNA_ID=CAMNT_0010529713 /DNA_START=244 /DNA_END=925 /DNA_ORIENTATION=-
MARPAADNSAKVQSAERRRGLQGQPCEDGAHGHSDRAQQRAEHPQLGRHVLFETNKLDTALCERAWAAELFERGPDIQLPVQVLAAPIVHQLKAVFEVVQVAQDPQLVVHALGVSIVEVLRRAHLHVAADRPEGPLLRLQRPSLLVLGDEGPRTTLPHAEQVVPARCGRGDGLQALGAHLDGLPALGPRDPASGEHCAPSAMRHAADSPTGLLWPRSGGLALYEPV